MGREFDICNRERFNRKRIILLVDWMYSILIEDEFWTNRDELMNKLEKRGIETRTFFIPMHAQPVFQNMGLFKFKGESYPVAEELARKGLYLPSSSGLKKEEIRYICDAIKDIDKRR
jgi:perosamine synthetase